MEREDSKPLLACLPTVFDRSANSRSEPWNAIRCPGGSPRSRDRCAPFNFQSTVSFAPSNDQNLAEIVSSFSPLQRSHRSVSPKHGSAPSLEIGASRKRSADFSTQGIQRKAETDTSRCQPGRLESSVQDPLPVAQAREEEQERSNPERNTKNPTTRCLGSEASNQSPRAPFDNTEDLSSAPTIQEDPIWADFWRQLSASANEVARESSERSGLPEEAKTPFSYEECSSSAMAGGTILSMLEEMPHSSSMGMCSGEAKYTADVALDSTVPPLALPFHAEVGERSCRRSLSSAYAPTHTASDEAPRPAECQIPTKGDPLSAGLAVEYPNGGASSLRFSEGRPTQPWSVSNCSLSQPNTDTEVPRRAEVYASSALGASQLCYVSTAVVLNPTSTSPDQIEDLEPSDQPIQLDRSSDGGDERNGYRTTQQYLSTSVCGENPRLPSTAPCVRVEDAIGFLEHETVQASAVSNGGAPQQGLFRSTCVPLSDRFEDLPAKVQAEIERLRNVIAKMPRRKLRDSLAETLTIRDFLPVMGINRDDLAEMLKLGVTTLKSFVHHELGIPRWPARSLKSTGAKVRDAEEKFACASREGREADARAIQADIERLRCEQKTMMCRMLHAAAKKRRGHMSDGRPPKRLQRPAQPEL